MSRALLDINVLLALLDSDHTHHGRARDWIEADIAGGWASCAITQNGFVRIVCQERYPSPVAPSEAISRLAQATRTAHHQFWPCTISLLDESVIDRTHVLGPRQVTDAYLLALATQNGGRFVTFDQAVPRSAVPMSTLDNLIIL